MGKEKNEKKFVSQIRVLRHSNGIKQTKLAEKAKISQQKISRFELGKAKPTADELERIKKAFLKI